MYTSIITGVYTHNNNNTILLYNHIAITVIIIINKSISNNESLFNMDTIDGDQVLIIIMYMTKSLYTVVDGSRRIQAKVICIHYKIHFNIDTINIPIQ